MSEETFVDHHQKESEPSASDGHSPGGRWRVRIARWGVWMVGLGALAYVLWVVPVGQVWRAAAGARALWTGLVVAVGVVGLLLADALGLAKALAVLGVPVGYLRALRLRGLTYGLAAVNYNAGQAGLAVLLSTYCDLDFVTALGCAAGTVGVQFASLLLVTSGALLAVSSGPMTSLRAYGFAGLGLLGLGVGIVALAPGLLWRWRFTRPMVRAGLSGLSVATLWRLPHLAVLYLLNWVVMGLYGIHLPLGEGLVRLSAYFFVVALPISVQGLGTGQAAALALFGPYASKGRASVVAFSLSVWVFAVLCQVLLGFVFAAVESRKSSRRWDCGQRFDDLATM